MKILRAIPFALLFTFAIVFGAKASDPLVSADWLLKNYDQPGLALIDVRHPGAFAQRTVPGAVNTDYARGWRVDIKGVPALLPPKAMLAKLIGGLGWFVTYELMGNSESRLYDGSMAEWTRDSKNPVEVLVPLD